MAEQWVKNKLYSFRPYSHAVIMFF